MKKWILCITLVSLSLFSCKKEPDTTLRIAGTVSDIRNDLPIEFVGVKVQEQVLESGSFNSSFRDADTDISDANGTYNLEFPRQNAAEYKLIFDRPEYFGKEKSINPDDINPDEPYFYNAQLTPISYLTVHLVNQNPFDSDDRILYRNLNAYFSCVCCDVSWVEAIGTTVDTSFTCKLHGDFTVDYTWEVRRNEVDSVYNASIFCPAFEETILTIAY